MKLNSVWLKRTLVALPVFAGFAAAVPMARAETTTVKGEVVDLMCYLDKGSKGESHSNCAKKCIESGGMAAILTADNKLYLVSADKKPMNDKLAPLAAKTVTIKGKLVERDGMKMIEDAEIEK